MERRRMGRLKDAREELIWSMLYQRMAREELNWSMFIIFAMI